MIFDIPEHIDSMFKGIKTETRRLNDSYQVGRFYAIQSGRGEKGMQNFAIMIEDKWQETEGNGIPISKECALAEGNYTPEQYEKIFKLLNPKWNGKERWAYKIRIVYIGDRIKKGNIFIVPEVSP